MFTTSPVTLAPLGNVRPLAMIGAARTPWNAWPTFAVSLLSLSVIRISTDVPAGIFAISPTAATVPSITNSATANFRLNLRSIGHSQFYGIG
jgi:hypothetical protein